MAKYEPNIWDLYDPNIPDEDQPNSFITKRKLDRMEKGIEDASIKLEIGDIKIGEGYDVSIVEDAENGTRKLNITFPSGALGQDGKSAYDIWLEEGNVGTEEEFLEYLKGTDGLDGQKGESAYQVWLSAGNEGTEEDFLNSLRGETGLQGEKGVDGKSAYESWLAIEGNEGKSEDEFLASLKGETGAQGPQGLSAFEVWQMIPGNENKTVNEFFEFLKGEPGQSASALGYVDF